MGNSVKGLLLGSGHQRLRRYFLLGVHFYIVFHLLAWYVFDWKVWGKTAMLGVLSLAAGRINAAAIMVSLIFLTIPLYGRFFCGWFCHLRGAIELGDWVIRKVGLSHYKKLRDKNVLLNTNFIWLFRFVTMLSLLLPVFAFYISGKFHLNLNPEPLPPMADLPGYMNKLFAEKAIINMALSLSMGHFIIALGAVFFILFVIGFVMNYFYGQGAFCRILCPYAVLFAGLMNLSPLQKKITRVGDCTGCRKCSNNCPQGIDVSREIYNYNGKVTNRECIKCYHCVDICEHKVLADLRKPAVPQLTSRKEYERKPWLNSHRHLQVIDSTSPAMDAASILVGVGVGSVVASFGGFWYYVGAIAGFTGFREFIFLIIGRKRANKITEVVSKEGFN